MSGTLAAAAPADLVRAELEAVARVLEEASASEIEVLHAAARHILSAGGKRIRPQITLLTALTVGGSLERAVPLAAACELVHTATLVHDDIVDDSDSRRGRTSVQFYYGNSASVLMGDFLVIRSFDLVARDPDRQIWKLMVDTIGRMCEGEVLQICVKGDTSIGIDVYETIIECKTALLMSACARIGARLGAVSPETEEALAAFGHHVGMAFQIQDDILDYTGTEAILGKPVGGDLRERKVTLPMLFALQAACDEDRARLLEIYERQGPLTQRDIAETTDLAASLGGFARAADHARDHIARAKRRLQAAPAGPGRAALDALAEMVVERAH